MCQAGYRVEVKRKGSEEREPAENHVHLTQNLVLFWRDMLLLKCTRSEQKRNSYYVIRASNQFHIKMS